MCILIGTFIFSAYRRISKLLIAVSPINVALNDCACSWGNELVINCSVLLLDIMQPLLLVGKQKVQNKIECFAKFKKEKKCNLLNWEKYRMNLLYLASNACFAQTLSIKWIVYYIVDAPFDYFHSTRCVHHTNCR